MKEPVLTEGDRHNPTWLRLEKHLKERLQAVREQNDKDLSERTTQRLRGHIECLTQLIALGTEQKPLPSDNELFKD